MAHVIVNGIELHYDRVGEGPPVLLLHGLGSSVVVGISLGGMVGYQLAADRPESTV